MVGPYSDDIGLDWPVTRLRQWQRPIKALDSAPPAANSSPLGRYGSEHFSFLVLCSGSFDLQLKTSIWVVRVPADSKMFPLPKGSGRL